MPPSKSILALPLILLLAMIKLSLRAHAAQPLLYWNDNGHCVERSGKGASGSGSEELIRDPNFCNKGKPVYLSDGKDCFELELDSETNTKTSNSRSQQPYRLKGVSFFHCDSTRAIYWKIGTMSCIKTDNDQNLNLRKSETVSMSECPQGIRPLSGSCYIDTHFDSKSQFTRAKALPDSTPCEYTRYIQFGPTCYHFLAKNPTFYAPNVFSHYESFDYSIHRIEEKYCKQPNTAANSHPSKPDASKTKRLSRSHRGFLKTITQSDDDDDTPTGAR